jgi:hypothetical protein
MLMDMESLLVNPDFVLINLSPEQFDFYLVAVLSNGAPLRHTFERTHPGVEVQAHWGLRT